MTLQTDEDGNYYIELDRPQNEKIRLTYIPKREWASQDVVRIHAIADSGKPRHGPEIPVNLLGDFVSGLINLLNSQAQEKG
jgi:hypothetical protein